MLAGTMSEQIHAALTDRHTYDRGRHVAAIDAIPASWQQQRPDLADAVTQPHRPPHPGLGADVGRCRRGAPGCTWCVLPSVPRIGNAQGSSRSSSPSRERRPYWSGIHPQPQIATGASGVMP